MNTHCRLIPSYAGLRNTTTATGMCSPTAVPKLNLAAVSAEKGHAGMYHRLCPWTIPEGKASFACFLSIGKQVLLGGCCAPVPRRHAYTSSMHITPTQMLSHTSNSTYNGTATVQMHIASNTRCLQLLYLSIFPLGYCCMLEVTGWPAPDEAYVNAYRQGSLSVGWSVQHALRSRGALWPHCSTVRPCGVSCQPSGHVFKSCSGKVGRWGSFSTGSNCTASSGWPLQGGPGWVPAYDSQRPPCTLLHWALPLVWCIDMAGNILIPPGDWQ